MKTGMLWFDNDPKTDLPAKIERASDYYFKKYGQRPNLCFVHPSMLTAPQSPPQGVSIESNRQVLPFHLWLGFQTVAS